MPDRFMKCPTKAVCALLLLLAALPGELAAQAPPYTMEDLQLWVSSGVRTPRILQRVRGVCFDVQLSPAYQDQMRQIGASQELIDGLVALCPPRLVDQAPPVSLRERIASRYSRRVLYPLYYDHPAALVAYGGMMTPQWKGTDPGTHQVDRPNDGGELRVVMPEAPDNLPTYGVSVGSASGMRLDMEAYLHQRDFQMLMVGPSYEPFLPLGRTRVRFIMGVNGWLAVAGQRMQVVDQLGLETSDTLTVTSFGAGGDGRVGVAYHPRPGMWVFAEARYRWIETFYRDAGVSSSERIEDFPWPKLSVRGPSIRIGVGF